MVSISLEALSHSISSSPRSIFVPRTVSALDRRTIRVLSDNLGSTALDLPCDSFPDKASSLCVFSLHTTNKRLYKTISPPFYSITQSFTTGSIWLNVGWMLPVASE